MRFKNPIDPVGGPLVALIAAWAMAAFVMATLHTSPMPKDAFSGKLVHRTTSIRPRRCTAPDLGWLRFVDRVTKSDAFGHAAADGFLAKAFVQIYADHREKFGKANAQVDRRAARLALDASTFGKDQEIDVETSIHSHCRDSVGRCGRRWTTSRAIARSASWRS